MATKYTVNEPCTAELVDGFGGRFVFQAQAGPQVPKNEREELALEHLVSLGLARRGGSKED